MQNLALLNLAAKVEPHHENTKVEVEHQRKHVHQDHSSDGVQEVDSIVQKGECCDPN